MRAIVWRGSAPMGPEEYVDEKSCDLRDGPLAKHDRANFAEGRKISALAFGCAAVISAAASGVARHGGQGCEKGEDGRRRNLRTK